MNLIKKQNENDEPTEQPTEEAITNIINEEPSVFKNCMIDNIKKLPLDAISIIINYMPRVTIKPIYKIVYSGNLEEVKYIKGY